MYVFRFRVWVSICVNMCYVCGSAAHTTIYVVAYMCVRVYVSAYRGVRISRSPRISRSGADEVVLADHMYCQGDEADECDARSSGETC